MNPLGRKREQSGQENNVQQQQHTLFIYFVVNGERESACAMQYGTIVYVCASIQRIGCWLMKRWWVLGGRQKGGNKNDDIVRREKETFTCHTSP